MTSMIAQGMKQDVSMDIGKGSSLMEMQEFLQELKKLKARITGSHADGTANENSDYDFYITEKNWKSVVKLFASVDPNFESCICGHVGTRIFPVTIEASMLFKHRKNRVKSVTIEGIEFLTY